MLFLVAIACTTAEEPPPELSFLAPVAGSTVPAGDVGATVVVDHFTLEEETTSLSFPLLPLMPALAFAHNEGQAAGFVRFSLDDVDLDDVYVTQYTVTGVTAGEHTLGAELRYHDGDELDPPVSASVTFTAE